MIEKLKPETVNLTNMDTGKPEPAEVYPLFNVGDKVNELVEEVNKLREDVDKLKNQIPSNFDWEG